MTHMLYFQAVIAPTHWSLWVSSNWMWNQPSTQMAITLKSMLNSSMSPLKMNLNTKFGSPEWIPTTSTTTLQEKSNPKRVRPHFRSKRNGHRCKMGPIPSIVPFGFLKMKWIGSLGMQPIPSLGEMSSTTATLLLPASDFPIPERLKSMYIMRQMFCI